MTKHRTQQEIDAYLDGELADREREDFSAHYRICRECRSRVEARQALVQAIRAARQHTEAPASLRTQVEAILNQAPIRPESKLPFQTKKRWFEQWLLPRGFPKLGYAGLLLCLLGAGMLAYLWQKQARATDLVAMAMATHQRQLANAPQLDFRSVSAREVTRWCNANLPFTVRLPTYQDNTGDRSKYELMGASLASFRDQRAADITYRMGQERISLIIVPSDRAIASGGEITRAKSLIFHTVRKEGLEVITWSVHGLTYALVSNVNLPKQQSCVVCHANPRDQSWQQSNWSRRAANHELRPL